MKKHKTLFVVFGAVVAIILLGIWALWSDNIYNTANRYADQLTAAWKDLDKAAKDLSYNKVELAEMAKGRSINWDRYVLSAAALIANSSSKEEIKAAIVSILTKHPEYFGFKGDKNDAEAVQKWAGEKAGEMVEEFPQTEILATLLENIEKAATAPSPAPAPTPTVPAPAAPAVPATPASTTPPAPASTAPVTPTTPAPTVPVAPAPTPTPTVPPAPPVPAAPTTKVVVKEVALGIPESAIPQAGDGVERIFQRQLDPTQKLVFLNDKGEKVDLSFVGDAADKLAVKDWKGQTANKIAVLHGYFDPKTGNEVRIRAPGIVAYVLVTEDDKLAGVKECRKNPEGKFGAEYTRLQETAKSYATAQFKGSVDGGIQSYEYLWTPQMKSEKPSINAASISSLPSQTISASSLISQIDTIDLVLNSQGQFQIATVFGLWG